MKQLSCNYCKKNFENGEFVAIGLDKFYHTIIRHLDKEPRTCLIDQMQKGDKALEIFNKFTRQELLLSSRSGYIGVYYNGGLYYYDQIDELKKTSKLNIGFNDSMNGDKVIGNLEQLSNMKPFFPKKTFKEKILRFLGRSRLDD